MNDRLIVGLCALWLLLTAYSTIYNTFSAVMWINAILVCVALIAVIWFINVDEDSLP